MKWSETLQERREALGLSRAQLAARSGVSLNTIRRIEIENAEVKPTTRVALDKALDMGDPEDRLSEVEAELDRMRRRVEELTATLQSLIQVRQSDPPAH